MFGSFRREKRFRRGGIEDPAATGAVLSGSESGRQNIIDFALIDETVNEWLSGSDSAEAAVILPDSHSVDRVLERALQIGLMSQEELHEWQGKYAPAGEELTWRSVARNEVYLVQSLERLAAEVYGFRPVLVCQMGSLVQADLLTKCVSPDRWQQLFELGIAPVVEHGKSPGESKMILCISKDPTNRRVWQLVNDLTEFKASLVYADGSVVSGMLKLMAQQISAIGASLYVTRPKLQKVTIDQDWNKKAA